MANGKKPGDSGRQTAWVEYRKCGGQGGTRKFINQTSEKHFRIVVVRVVVAIAIDNGKNSTWRPLIFDNFLPVGWWWPQASATCHMIWFACTYLRISRIRQVYYWWACHVLAINYERVKRWSCLLSNVIKLWHYKIYIVHTFHRPIGTL